jgi:type IV pilus assembly protein PilV
VNLTTSNRTRKSRQNGASLVEVLVALLLLSIGLLGVAGLQINALQVNRSAHVRSQASVLAYYIADRMRANRDSALGGGYNLAFGATPSGATMNMVDLANWKAEITNTLPAGDADLLITGNIVRIRVRWTDKSVTETFETHTEI